MHIRATKVQILLCSHIEAVDVVPGQTVTEQAGLGLRCLIIAYEPYSEALHQLFVNIVMLSFSFSFSEITKLKNKTKQKKKKYKYMQINYSRLSLSRIPRDSLKYFEISVPGHIRFAELRKK